MAKMSKEQADQLAELERLRDAPDEADDDQGDDDDGHVIVLRGSRADAFLSSLLGPTKTAKPAKTVPPKKTAASSAGQPPASTEGDDATDDGAGDDAPPPKSNRYFR